jgi:signal transduction histidine kinase
MKNLFIFLIISLVLTGSAFCQGKSESPADAEAMVKKAVTFYKTNGKDKAFAEFNNTKGKFVSGDLYIFVYDLTGKCVSHGGNPKMIGKDLIGMKDADNKFFVKERIEIVNSKGKGWQNYKMTNPTTKQIENKTAYIEKLDGFVIGCGAYKK